MEQGAYQRKDRLVAEQHKDVYREKEKFPESTQCKECGALFTGGRWTWKKTHEKVYVHICPACRRRADSFPAGIIEIRGNFFKEHKDEILNMIYNVEKAEKEEHPLERIMNITQNNHHVQVTTTGIHIARRIGEALAKSFNGENSFHFSNDDTLLRVIWER